jgi:hypothetical protein
MNKLTIKFKDFIDKYGLIISLTIGIIAGLTTIIWSFQNNYITTYGDAKSHLNIARRIIDSLTPGIAQLGGSWLPFQHLLLLPFVANNFLYRSGLAGTVISFLSYILCQIFIFKTINLLTNKNIIALFGTLIFSLNSNILYMQTTPMGELLTICLVISATYYFVLWQRKKQLSQLIIMSIFIFLGTLTRYEVWALVPSSVLAITLSVISEPKKNRPKLREIESRIILFLTLAMFGIIIWLIWNLLIFGNPLYFLQGSYSAKAYQLPLLLKGLNKPYHNILYAFLYYLYTTIDTNELFVVISGFLGSILYLFQNRNLKALALFGFAITIFLFESFSLYKGNTTIYIPQLFPFDYYNVRYGLYSIPFFIIFCSYLLSIKNILITILFIFILLFQTSYSLFYFHPITLSDTLYLNSPVFGDRVQRELAKKEAVIYFKKNYKDGLILTPAGVFDEFIFLSGIDLKKFITEGSGKYWSDSLAHPAKYASWIILNQRDEFNDVRSDLNQKIYNTPELNNNFILVFNKGLYLIYKRK